MKFFSQAIFSSKYWVQVQKTCGRLLLNVEKHLRAVTEKQIYKARHRPDIYRAFILASNSVLPEDRKKTGKEKIIAKKEDKGSLKGE